MILHYSLEKLLNDLQNLNISTPQIQEKLELQRNFEKVNKEAWFQIRTRLGNTAFQRRYEYPQWFVNVFNKINNCNKYSFLKSLS